MGAGVIPFQNEDEDAVDTWAKVDENQVTAILDGSLVDVMGMQFDADIWVDLTVTALDTPPIGAYFYNDGNGFQPFKGVLVHTNDEEPSTVEYWAKVIGGVVVGLAMNTTTFMSIVQNQYKADYWVNLTQGGYDIPQQFSLYDPEMDEFSIPPTDDLAELTDKLMAIHTAMIDALTFAQGMQYRFNVEQAGSNATLAIMADPNYTALAEADSILNVLTWIDTSVTTSNDPTA